MASLSLLGVHTIWAIIVPQFLFAIGHGVHQPCGQAGTIGPFPEKAGAAASISGFVTMVSAFSAGLWMGSSLNGTVYPLTLTVGASDLAARVAFPAELKNARPA